MFFFLWKIKILDLPLKKIWAPFFCCLLLSFLQNGKILRSKIRNILWNFLSFAKLFQIPLRGDTQSKKAGLQLPHRLRANWQQTVDHLYVIRIERVPPCCWKNGVKRMVKFATMSCFLLFSPTTFFDAFNLYKTFTYLFLSHKYNFIQFAFLIKFYIKCAFSFFLLITFRFFIIDFLGFVNFSPHPNLFCYVFCDYLC
jgi:hypothetical protein